MSMADTSSYPVPRHGARTSSFYWALKCLPAPKRRAIFCIYAFCRAVDDIADGTLCVTDKVLLLERHGQAIEALFAHQDTEIDVVCALKPYIARYALEKADFLALIAGMRMDAEACVRMADRTAFDLYLDRVACAVGRLSNAVFGLKGSQADALAHHLGRALQITNILRDLREDAGRGRLYLPGDLLRACALDEDTPDRVLVHPQLEDVLLRLAGDAERDFAAAAVLLETLCSKKVRAVRMMMAAYLRVLAKLKARGLARVDVPVRLGRTETLWIALRHAIA